MSKLANPVERICIIDDDPIFRRWVNEMLHRDGRELISFSSAEEFISWFDEGKNRCDLIVSDIQMGGASGYQLCRHVRSHTQADDNRIPVILVTGDNVTYEKAKGLEAGADDFVQKPFRNRDLAAKVDSLLKIRASDLNKSDKISRLTRFLSPAVARHLVSDLPETLLTPHRVDVTVLFIDLRRFTAFAERNDPDEVMQVLGRYYTLVGETLLHHQATIAHLAGDGIMAFFNDPEPIKKHEEVAVLAALAVRDKLLAEKDLWTSKNYDIDFGIGLAEGPATIGGMGFDHFWQYSVIGPVANLAARLCQVAENRQILVSHRFLTKINPEGFRVLPLGEIGLKGFDRPTSVFNVVGTEQP